MRPSRLHVSVFRSVCLFVCMCVGFFFFFHVVRVSVLPFGHFASLSISLLCRPRTSGSYFRGTRNMVV